MNLFIYNTLSQKKEKFVPLTPPQVRMYCCGPTVYDLLHIGNFRGAVFYNFLRLWLEHLGYKVSFHYNLTDVDDKIIQKSIEEKSTSEKTAQKYIEEFFKDFKSLNLKDHSANPKATEFISQMIQFIEKLVQEGKAYSAEGNVFYHIKSFKQYGKLSHKNLEDLKTGVRKAVIPFKKDPLDFTLWKKAKPGEPYWNSPWGKGRPGWHTECVVMIHHGLGSSIDIHGGGMDLIFPHHENEKAQSEACGKNPFVKYWVHHNMFETDGEKISKSLGHFQTMRSFLNEYNAEIFKYLVLNTHYRSVSEISKKTVYQAMSGLSRIYQALWKARQITRTSNTSPHTASNKEVFLKNLRQTRTQVEEAFNDDLNTAKALANLFSFIRFFNDSMKKDSFSKEDQEFSHLFLECFKEYGSILSLFQKDPEEFLDELDSILLKQTDLDRSQVNQMIQDRQKARNQKDFKTADQIRNQLKNQGIDIQDLKEGNKWRMNPGFFVDN